MLKAGSFVQIAEVRGQIAEVNTQAKDFYLCNLTSDL